MKFSVGKKLAISSCGLAGEICRADDTLDNITLREGVIVKRQLHRSHSAVEMTKAELCFAESPTKEYPIYVARCNYDLTSLKGMSIKNTLSVKINVKSNLNTLNVGDKVARVRVPEKFVDD